MQVAVLDTNCTGGTTQLNRLLPAGRGRGFFRLQALHFSEEIEAQRDLVPEKPAMNIIRIFNVRVRKEVVESATAPTKMPGPTDLAREFVLYSIPYKVRRHLAVQAILYVAHLCLMHINKPMARKHLSFWRDAD